MPDFVRVTNINDIPFDFHQNNKKRILPPGGDAIIPWHLACALFGHPGLVNAAPEYARQKQYQKIRGLYNFSTGLSQEAEWDHMKPHILVIDLETSEEIVMLMDDPEGIAQLTPVEMPRDQPDVAALMAQITRMQAQMQQLLNAQTGPQAPAPGTPQSPTVTSDAPPPQVDPPPAMDLGELDEDGLPRSSAFNAVPAPVVVVHDPDGAISVNDAAEELNLGKAAVSELDIVGSVSFDAQPAEASADSPQAVSTGDEPPAAATARRARAPKPTA